MCSVNTRCFLLESGQRTKGKCRGDKTRAPDLGLREMGCSRVRARVGSFLNILDSFSSVSNFRGPVRSPTEGGESRKGKLQETNHLPLEAAATLPSAAATATATKPACAAPSTLPPRTLGLRRAAATGPGDSGARHNQSSSRSCGGFRNLVVSGQRREPHCLPCVYLAPLRGWKFDLRGDQALSAPARRL